MKKNLDKNSLEYWEKILESEGLGDLDKQENFGETNVIYDEITGEIKNNISSILEGEIYDIDDLKDKIDIKISEEKGKIDFSVDGIKIGFAKFLIENNNTIILEKFFNMNSRDENNFSTEARKELGNLQTNISGLGSFMFEKFFEFSKNKGFSRIMFISIPEANGFYEKILPKMEEKYSGEYETDGKNYTFYFYKKNVK